MKTDAMTKAIYVGLILAALYIVYELLFGQHDGWELGQFLLVGFGILLIACITYFGNKITRR